MKKKKLSSADIANEAEDLKAFGERLKEARSQLKLLQKDFAANLDVSGSFLSELEKGKAKPGFDVLRKMYFLYNINIHYLIDGQGELFVKKDLASIVGPDDLSAESRTLRELLYYIENAPVVKYAVFEYFATYLHKNKDLVKGEMKKHRQFLRDRKKSK